MAARLNEIDRRRGEASGLSGAVRVWVLQRTQALLLTEIEARRVCRDSAAVSDAQRSAN